MKYFFVNTTRGASSSPHHDQLTLRICVAKSMTLTALEAEVICSCDKSYMAITLLVLM